MFYWWPNFSFKLFLKHVLQSKFEKKVSGKREKEEKIKTGESNRLRHTGSHNPHPEHRKYNFKFCSQESVEIPELGGCSGMASLALVELKPITQRKRNCTEQTVGGWHGMAHPAGRELRNSSTTTENTPQEPTVLWYSIQFTHEENSKAECL